jgi:hypothetical protein
MLDRIVTCSKQRDARPDALRSSSANDLAHGAHINGARAEFVKPGDRRRAVVRAPIPRLVA